MRTTPKTEPVFLVLRIRTGMAFEKARIPHDHRSSTVRYNAYNCFLYYSTVYLYITIAKCEKYKKTTCFFVLFCLFVKMTLKKQCFYEKNTVFLKLTLSAVIVYSAESPAQDAVHTSKTKSPAQFLLIHLKS